MERGVGIDRGGKKPGQKGKLKKMEIEKGVIFVVVSRRS